MLFAFGRGASQVSFREARAAIREKQGRGLVTIGPRRRFVATPGMTAESVHPWRIAAAAAAGVAFALGWGSGYIGARSGSDTPPTAPTRMMQMNEASAAPTANEAAAPPVAPRIETVVAPSPAPSPAAAPEAHDEAAERRADEVVASVPSVPAAPERAEFREIVVPRGTSLSTLAHQYYGEGGPKLLKRIRDLNPQIVDVDQIFAGDRLKLPALDEPDRPHE
jgi:hypothetical protein